jgi:CDP-6-deoxy-D-xylo-4-hexulose-3-dehydrase
MKIINKLKMSKDWNNQFTFIYSNKKVEPSWFGLPILINKKYVRKKNKFLSYLNKNGIETRPIISGNFLNQPSVNLYNLNKAKKILKNCQDLEERGFFIGLHTEPISKNNLDYLVNNLLKI